MSIGSSAGAGDVLRVDPEMLSQLGSQLETSARALPNAPEPFTVTGADAISQAIAAKLPGLETPIIEGLPAVKEAAGQTASNIVTAAGMYQTTDEQIAAEYEKHQFDGSGSGAGGGSGGGMGAGGAVASGAGGALGGASSAAGSATGSGGDAMGQMSQMMGTPMQMASQAAQMPMQAMGAVSSLPQGAMQGVQQISQMAGGMGKGEGGSGSGDAPVGPPSEEARADERAAAERAAEERQAAGSEERRERVPESAVAHAPQTDSAVPDQRPSGPRHAAPDPTIDV